VIFVDTSFWAALTARDDARHHDAVELFRRHETERLLTSNHVRGETWTFLRRRRGFRSAVSFLDSLERTTRLRLEFVSHNLEEDALRWLRQHDEREYSFVDATSFAVMHSLRIREALAFDGDFAAAGFVELGQS
jgi:predicted nucleic acid-binding protein